MCRSFQQGLKKIIFPFFICLMFSVVQFSFAQLSIGTTAPNFTLPYLEGISNFNLFQNLGTLTIIYFWSSVSEPQKEQMLMLKNFYEEYSQKRIQVVAILSFPEFGDKDSAVKFIREKDINFINLIDDQKVTKDYGVTWTPAFFVLDENRRILESGTDITFELSEAIRKKIKEIKSETVKRETKKIKKEPIRIPRREPGPPSPIPYGLAGAGLNAILPGCGSLVYGRFESKTSIGIITTAGFYLSGLFYLIDIFSKPNNFFVKEDAKYYDRITKVELYITAGFYSLNIVSGFIAGIDYGKKR